MPHRNSGRTYLLLPHAGMGTTHELSGHSTQNQSGNERLVLMFAWKWCKLKWRKRERFAHVRLQMMQTQEGNERDLLMFACKCVKLKKQTRMSSHICRSKRVIYRFEIDRVWKLRHIYCLAGLHQGFWRCPNLGNFEIILGVPNWKEHYGLGTLRTLRWSWSKN